MSEDMAVVETVEFNGFKYKRYPESRHATSRVYFHRMDWVNGKRQPRYLHRDAWESVNGAIPDGYHIHHVDHDTLNNSIDNLQCLPSSEHYALHEPSDELRAKLRRNIEIARPFACAWHGSEAGRAWHREHGKETWKNRVPARLLCSVCGAEYATLTPHKSKFCGNNCKSSARRASGADKVERKCPVCCSLFTSDKYSKVKTCSRACGRRNESRPGF